MLIAIIFIIFTIGLTIALIGNTVICIKNKWLGALIGLDILLSGIICALIDAILTIFSNIA